MKLNLIGLLLLLTSCAGYVQGIHNQFDKEDRAKRQAILRAQPGPYGDRRPIQNPVSINGRVDMNNVNNLPPGINRQYAPQGKRRYSTHDLQDNDQDGSLWSGKSPDSFLFVTNNIKKPGDIVIVEVMSGLKLKISEELKQAFPQSTKTTKTETDKDDKKTDAAAATEKPEKELDPKVVYDKISTSVTERLNKDYLLVRGRKEVIYQKVKRYLEFQGIVSSKDIRDNDSVSSAQMLEPKITVLRY